MSVAAAFVVSALAGCSDDDGDGTVRFSASAKPFAFAAAQDGDGPWFVVEPSSNGEYAFPVTSATYGIAFVCTYASYATVTIVRATPKETTSPRFECVAFDEGTATLTGTFAGTMPGQLASVNVSYLTTFTDAGTYTAAMLPAGQWDVFAMRRIGQFQPIVADRIIRRDSVMLSSDSSTVLDFDFEAEGFAPDARTVSFEGVESTDPREVSVNLRNQPGGTYLAFGPFTNDGYLGLPVSELRGDDIHSITATAYGPDRRTFRQVRRWLRALEDFTAVLPPFPALPQVDAEASTPYVRMRGTVPAGLDADRYDFVYVQSVQSNSSLAWIATLTRGYVATGATQYTLPDLTSLAGFSPAWGLLPAVTVDWQFITMSTDGTVADLLEAGQSAAALDGRRDEITQQTGRFLP